LDTVREKAIIFSWGRVQFKVILHMFNISKIFNDHMSLCFVFWCSGFASAACMTSGMAYLASVFPPHTRGRAMNIAMVGVALGVCEHLCNKKIESVHDNIFINHYICIFPNGRSQVVLLLVDFCIL
jgi:hypothetical protein